jgi:RNA polymerase sigma factor (sigma-70 family)
VAADSQQRLIEPIEEFLASLRPRAIARAHAILASHSCGMYSAEDAVQEAFARVANIPDLMGYSNPGAFALRSVRNAAIDHIRAHTLGAELITFPSTSRRQGGSRPDFEPADSGLGGEEMLLSEEQKDRIMAVLVRLTPRQRQLVALRYWHDLSLDEIAQRTGKTVNYLKTTLSRTRARLKELLVAEFGHDQR